MSSSLSTCSDSTPPFPFNHFLRVFCCAAAASLSLSLSLCDNNMMMNNILGNLWGFGFNRVIMDGVGGTKCEQVAGMSSTVLLI